MKEKVKKADREQGSTRSRILYLQKQAAEALRKEFGFAPTRLKEIVLQEADDFGFHICFRVKEHYYNYHYGKIERTDDSGVPL
jgi:hypothetical protein